MSVELKFEERLARMEATLRQIAATPSVEEKESLASTLIADYFEVGLALVRQPELHRSPEFLRFFETAMADVVDATTGVQQFIYATEGRCGDTWYGNEWRGICVRRSGIQFFLDLYWDSDISPAIRTMEVEILDEAIKRRGQYEGHLEEAERPGGMPPSHWWWWYPDPPPGQS